MFLSIVARISGPQPLHLFSADILKRKQRTRLRSGRSADSWLTVQNPKSPLRGKIIFNDTSTPYGQIRSASRFQETPDSVP